MQCALYTSPSTCAYYQATSSPLFVQDVGNVSFGLAIIIFIIGLATVGFLFNSFGGSRV